MARNKFKNHASLTTHRDIGEICQRLFVDLDINIMNFIRVTPDRKIAYLCDNHAWLQHYLKNNYPLIGAFEQKQDFQQCDHVLWTALSEDDPIVIYSREMFNINHGITLVRCNGDSYDFFNFGTSLAENVAKQQLLNKLDNLNQFTQEFYDKAKRLIVKASKHAFSISQFTEPNNNDSVITFKRQFHLGPKFGYQYLTERELEALFWLTQGLAVPDIADKMGIAGRTIEKYVESLKQKLGCKTRCQLGFQAANLGLGKLPSSAR